MLFHKILTHLNRIFKISQVCPVITHISILFIAVVIVLILELLFIVLIFVSSK